MSHVDTIFNRLMTEGRDLADTEVSYAHITIHTADGDRVSIFILRDEIQLEDRWGPHPWYHSTLAEYVADRQASMEDARRYRIHPLAAMRDRARARFTD